LTNTGAAVAMPQPTTRSCLIT